MSTARVARSVAGLAVLLAVPCAVAVLGMVRAVVEHHRNVANGMRWE